jgi:hypothetical protein
MPLMAGMLSVLTLSSAAPQGSIDAGKSPAQIFADTCSNCHRRPQELKRASATFLRQHYTPGAQEAAAMAAYLTNVAVDPRAAKDRPKGALEKGPLEKGPLEKAKAPLQAQDQRPADRPQAQPQAPKAKQIARGGITEPPEPPVEVPAASAPVPRLEPFEE